MMAISLLKKRKDRMNLEARLIRLKGQLGKKALREPRNGNDVLIRMQWERVRKILVKRYGRLD
tara:strand:- start:9064 stop:9252 length:189 start_codon:yes stop_codon:yes gene_type:complete